MVILRMLTGRAQLQCKAVHVWIKALDRLGQQFIERQPVNPVELASIRAQPLVLALHLDHVPQAHVRVSANHRALRFGDRHEQRLGAEPRQCDRGNAELLNALSLHRLPRHFTDLAMTSGRKNETGLAVRRYQQRVAGQVEGNEVRHQMHGRLIRRHEPIQLVTRIDPIKHSGPVLRLQGVNGLDQGDSPGDLLTMCTHEARPYKGPPTARPRRRGMHPSNSARKAGGV